MKKATKPKTPKKEKVKKPRSYVARRIGVITFWVLFGFMFLVVVTTVFSSSSSTPEEEKTVELNPSTKPEAIQFARDFTKEYFNWDKDKLDQREERLKPYLAKGLHEQAGLDLNGEEWDSSFKTATLKKVEEVGENKAHIVFLVNAELNKEEKKKVTKKKKGKKKKKKKKKTKTIVENKKETLEKYFVVPVAYNGFTLGVYSTPYFSNIYDETTINVENNEVTKKLRTHDNPDEAENIENFLNTFFASYAEDSPDKLSYISNDNSVIGLDGALDFVEVKDTEVYNSDKDNKYIVRTEVTFKDPETEVLFESIYYLLVVKENKHYVVDNMNAENLIEEITQEEFPPKHNEEQNTTIDDEDSPKGGDKKE